MVISWLAELLLPPASVAVTIAVPVVAVPGTLSVQLLPEVVSAVSTPS